MLFAEAGWLIMFIWLAKCSVIFLFVLFISLFINYTSLLSERRDASMKFLVHFLKFNPAISHRRKMWIINKIYWCIYRPRFMVQVFYCGKDWCVALTLAYKHMYSLRSYNAFIYFFLDLQLKIVQRNKKIIIFNSDALITPWSHIPPLNTMLTFLAKWFGCYSLQVSYPKIFFERHEPTSLHSSSSQGQ